MSENILITAIARTAQGNLLGALKDVSSPTLGATVIQAVRERANIPAENIDQVLMGCVLAAGLGQAPARQAALKAGLPQHVPAITINKMCGSSMQAMIIGHDMLKAGSASIVIAGGMESMTLAPYLLPKARAGYRLGHAELLDHLMIDGLEDAYDKGKPMGFFADVCAKELEISRETQDQFALASFTRAKHAIGSGFFRDEIVPVVTKNREGIISIQQDEHPFSVNLERIPSLSPIFVKDGTVTAGNASSIADGAAAVLMATEKATQQFNMQPLARIVAHSVYAQKPSEFPLAPVGAITRLLQKCGWTNNDVDLFEVNEAFAMVSISAMEKLYIPHEKINVHGGACALGHPIGASGARIVVTLISALKRYQLKRGVAALCIGGGEATAIAVELL